MSRDHKFISAAEVHLKLQTCVSKRSFGFLKDFLNKMYPKLWITLSISSPILVESNFFFQVLQRNVVGSSLNSSSSHDAHLICQKNPMALFSNGSQLWLPTTTWAATLVLSQHSPPLITVSPQSLSFCSYPFMLFSSQKPQKSSKIHFSNVSLLKKSIRERNTEHLQSSTNACKALVIWLHTYDLYKSLTHSHPVAASASSWSWKDRHVLS